MIARLEQKLARRRGVAVPEDFNTYVKRLEKEKLEKRKKKREKEAIKKAQLAKALAKKWKKTKKMKSTQAAPAQQPAVIHSDVQPGRTVAIDE